MENVSAMAARVASRPPSRHASAVETNRTVTHLELFSVLDPLVKPDVLLHTFDHHDRGLLHTGAHHLTDEGPHCDVRFTFGLNSRPPPPCRSAAVTAAANSVSQDSWPTNPFFFFFFLMVLVTPSAGIARRSTRTQARSVAGRGPDPPSPPIALEPRQKRARTARMASSRRTPILGMTWTTGVRKSARDLSIYL